MNKLATVPKSTRVETQPLPIQTHAIKIPKGRAIPNEQNPSPNVRIANNRSVGSDAKIEIQTPSNTAKQKMTGRTPRVIFNCWKFMKLS
jgi:hypothetical protein